MWARVVVDAKQAEDVEKVEEVKCMHCAMPRGSAVRVW